MEKKLEGKVAIVTGGSKGIGKATAIDLVKEGAHVVICARTENDLNQTEKELKKYHDMIIALRADVSKLSDVKKVVSRTLNKFGRIDILVNNAGILIVKQLAKMNDKELEETLDINLKGAFYFAREVLPQMIKQRSGVIINVSSGAGKHGFSYLSAYCATKFGMIGMTESLADELSEHKIRVYSVCPGTVDTDMQRDAPMVNRRFMLRSSDVSKRVLSLCMPDCRVRSGSSVDVSRLF